MKENENIKRKTQDEEKGEREGKYKEGEQGE